MVLLQPRLNLRVSQRQILTPGLVQMVSVLALNKLELKEMINAEMMENPVLDELETGVPMIDEVAGKEADRERAAAEQQQEAPVAEQKDPFEEIDFGSYFKDYLDPGFRSTSDFSEDSERPSFENFLSKPSTLTDHLMWQLRSIHVREAVRTAAELVIGNLNEDGYLTASDEELMALATPGAELPLLPKEPSAAEPPPAAEAFAAGDEIGDSQLLSGEPLSVESALEEEVDLIAPEPAPEFVPVTAHMPESANGAGAHKACVVSIRSGDVVNTGPEAEFTEHDLQEAIDLVRQLDPVGVAARDLRECLLAQLRYLRKLEEERVVRAQRCRNEALRNQTLEEQAGLDDEVEDESGEVAAYSGNGAGPQVNGTPAASAVTALSPQMQNIEDAVAVADTQLRNIQNKQFKDIVRAIGRPLEAVMSAIELIKTLDPKPGSRYNRPQTRLIEPDVAFIKQGEEYLVVMNDDDMPTLRLNPAYKRLLHRENAEREVRTYVKERYKSAIQLIKNIEQRKQTILKTCYAIIARQREFLDHGIDQLKPMMIKEVAEEIGVHPSTVSRAVANKYVHTAQGVYELRYFFSESVQGPEGGGTSLMILKRRVKKLIEEEDASRPLTDEQITKILQSQGIHVTRRTVAKYREDMKIPSTHQRRIKK